MAPHFHAELPSISQWSDREEDGVSHLTLPMAGTAGFLALTVSFVQLDDFPYRICWSTGYYCGGLRGSFDGSEMVEARWYVPCWVCSFEARAKSGGGGSQEHEPEGLRSSPVLFSLVCVFLRLCGLAWFGLHSGFVPSSKPGKQNETPPSMVHIGHGIQRR